MPTTYAIPDGRTVMAATLYTGTGANRSVSNAVNGVGFQPDLVWMKARSAANSHYLSNSIMGVGFGLSSDATSAQATVAAGKDLTSFDATGFSLGPEQTYGSSNTNGTSIVAWNWKAGGAAVTNTAGSISSQVSANTTAGFSVVTYTGTGANATVGHGLGVAPKMVIVKRRDSTSDWVAYHSGLPSAAYRIYLNYDLAQDGGAAAAATWNSTAPTGTVFSVGTNANSNASGGTFVAYCYAPVAGYSAFGSYTGNGSADGPFVYLGFRPRFVMFKRTDSTGTWFMEDTSRGTYNVMGPELYANSSDAEATVNRLDVLSNGFKMRAANAGDNASGGTYIYACFAENPFKFSNAR